MNCGDRWFCWGSTAEEPVPKIRGHDKGKERVINLTEGSIGLGTRVFVWLYYKKSTAILKILLNLHLIQLYNNKTITKMEHFSYATAATVDMFDLLALVVLDLL